MMSMNDTIFGAIPLSEWGDCVVWKRYQTEKGRHSSITINVPFAVGDGMCMPATSVVVSGTERLMALRAAIDEALENEEER